MSVGRGDAARIAQGAPGHTHPVDYSAMASGVAPYLGRRNRIINGDLSVNQRGFTTANLGLWFGGFTYDRWNTWTDGGTLTITCQAATPGELPEGAKQYIRLKTTGQATTGGSNFQQHIEGVRTLSGKTVTASLWARCASGTARIALDLIQSFGSGGSPSGQYMTPQVTLQLTTTWTRYTATFTLPSVAGKTLGTNNDDLVTFRIYVSTHMASPGIQNDTFDLWGIQLEEGPVATPFEQKTYAEELLACQRYYYRITSDNIYQRFGNGGGTTDGSANIVFQHPVTMRKVPALSYSAVGDFKLHDGKLNWTATSFTDDRQGKMFSGVTVAASGITASKFVSLTANNVTTAWLGFDAEL